MKTALTTVSETALITLRSRAVETIKEPPLIRDPQSLELINRFQSLELSPVQRKHLERIPPVTLSSYIKDHPDGLVISLGAGFDTRFWRIAANSGNYMELDLPEVVAVKRDLMGKMLEYEMIGCSVLENAWSERIATKQRENILFLAEGLLMYLPEKEVIRLFQKLASDFHHSQMVFEVVNRKYTRGIRKKMVESKMKRRSGTEAGTSYSYGIAQGKDIEAYADNLKVLEEWSYFEEPDVRPRMLRFLRHFKSFSRTQWTVRAEIL